MAEETKQQARAPGDELIMAHVLFLDIVGYSKLPMKRQRHALQRLQQLVRDTEEFGRVEDTGQLLCLPTGDGMALVFLTSTPLAPVQCALELGHALRGSHEIELRMGVHSGPVYPHVDIRVNQNVVGGGINIAQRVMDCGDAGHILLSKAVADVLNQIGGWAERLQDLGEIKVKHKFLVHIFNLCTPESGNMELPSKYRQARSFRRLVLIVLVCTLLAGLGFLSVGFWRWPSEQPAQRGRTSMWTYERTLVGHSDTVYSVAFTPDSRTVAGGSYDGKIILWDAQTGTAQRFLPLSVKSLVYTVALSSTGDNVAAGVGREVVLGNIKNGVSPHSLKGHTGFVFAVAFAPDGQTLASGSEDHTIRIWDVQTGQTLHTLTEHTDEVNAVAFSADAKLLVSGSYDTRILIWDVATWTVRARLTGHVGHVYSVAFAPDGEKLVSGSEDGTVRFWDVNSARLQQTLYQHQGPVKSVAFSPDGLTVASAGDDGVVILWDSTTGTVRQMLRRHTAGVASVSFASDGRTLASGGKDKTVLLWGLQPAGATLGASPTAAP